MIVGRLEQAEAGAAQHHAPDDVPIRRIRGQQRQREQPSANTASPMQPSRPACTRSTSRPAIGAMTTIASGTASAAARSPLRRGPMRFAGRTATTPSPAFAQQTSRLRCPSTGRRSGCAVNRPAAAEIPAQLAAHEHRANRQQRGDLAEDQRQALARAKPLMAVISRPKVNAFSTALVGSKRRLSLLAVGR